MNKFDLKKLDFKKMNGLIPAIIQDNQTDAVLMLGFMNKQSLQKTLKDKKVTFFSRTKDRLWQKGESSGNFLEVVSINIDCDKDSLLIKVNPKGPTCHTGDDSCFKSVTRLTKDLAFITELFGLIQRRKVELPKDSYTTSLFKSGLDRILQKVGEESCEVVIAGKNESDKRLIEECSDLIYHLLVLLAERKIDLKAIENELKNRSLAK